MSWQAVRIYRPLHALVNSMCVYAYVTTNERKRQNVVHMQIIPQLNTIITIKIVTKTKMTSQQQQIKVKQKHRVDHSLLKRSKVCRTQEI